MIRTGVTCGRKHKRVTRLDLGGFQLGGVISPFIGNLSFLTSVDVTDNSFGGTIPRELVNLFRLQHLNVSFNILEGGFQPVCSTVLNWWALISIQIILDKIGNGDMQVTLEPIESHMYYLQLGAVSQSNKKFKISR
ncbi:hypothetical protein Bca52824_044026 [Brassica carinata]|uniref:Uncharacterized protein n=1 Tax=Brassica carinata TaxID=52824 RepID=A0A8X7S0E2_BRACI|nr:hypothetical protein Bca52824_044026 [Brassica carinata]